MKYFALLLVLFFTACTQGPIGPGSVHAQATADPNSLFQGRYWFHSRGNNFFESGVITADGKGFFTLHSMYIDPSLNHGVNTAGNYQLAPGGAGTAQQGLCKATSITCNGDFEALFVSSDGAHAMMVSMEGTTPGAPWAVEMDRDPAPFDLDLSACDATSGAVLGCNDGWVTPTRWR